MASELMSYVKKKKKEKERKKERKKEKKRGKKCFKRLKKKIPYFGSYCQRPGSIKNLHFL